MLGIERERHTELRYFSTPVMTMPRTKTRWNRMKNKTGRNKVIKVPAWMNAGFW
jgi:hypothetical protein